MMQPDIRMNEVKLYWRALSDANRAKRENIAQDVIDELRDEIDVIGIQTDWPRLKAACVAACDSLLPEPKEAAGCGFLA